MRILYICGDLGIDVLGRKGASTHVRETCRQLAKRGHEVLLVTPTAEPSDELNFEVVPVAAPRAKWLGMDLRYVVLNRTIKGVLPGIIRRFQPDAMYERYALYQCAGRQIAERFNLPRILEINSILSEEMTLRLRFPSWAARCERRLWARERAIICVSSVLAQRIRECGKAFGAEPEYLVISPVGVDPDEFSPAVVPVNWERFGIFGKKIVGYTGTLTRWHGIDLLFDAADLVRKQGLPICFVVVGGDPEKVAALRKRSWDQGLGDVLKFLGSAPHSEIPAYMAGMDACVIPDTQDWSSPTKYFEMAAMQRPVVAANAPAITEVVGGDGIGALLFERGNVAEMVEKLKMVLNDSALAMRLGLAARERVMQKYSWDHNIGRILKIYESMGVRTEVSSMRSALKQSGDKGQ